MKLDFGDEKRKFFMNKEVDKSLLKDGFSIPVAFQEKLFNLIGVTLEFGESMEVEIHIDGRKYGASLKNQRYDKIKYPEHTPVVQIRYSPQSEIAKCLRVKFAKSHKYIEEHSLNKPTKTKIRIPEEQKEFMKIYVLKGENTLEFVCN